MIKIVNFDGYLVVSVYIKQYVVRNFGVSNLCLTGIGVFHGRLGAVSGKINSIVSSVVTVPEKYRKTEF